MCNQLHSDSKPIPASGKGWKMFNKFNKLSKGQYQDDSKILTGVCSSFYRAKGQTVKWHTDIYHDIYYGRSEGFCFFLSKRVAEKARKLWNDSTGSDCILLEIQYDRGLGKHREREFVGNHIFTVSLCKEFTVVDKSYKFAKGN